MVNIENELFEDIVATPLQLNQALPLGLAASWRRSCSFGFSSVSDVAAYIILIEAACRTFTVSVM